MGLRLAIDNSAKFPAKEPKRQSAAKPPADNFIFADEGAEALFGGPGVLADRDGHVETIADRWSMANFFV